MKSLQIGNTLIYESTWMPRTDAFISCNFMVYLKQFTKRIFQHEVWNKEKLLVRQEKTEWLIR